jgi:hypothetical protein
LENWKELAALIAKKWEAGYRIVNLEYGTNNWFFIYAKVKHPQAELYIRRHNHDTFRSSIRKYWKEGYRITDLAEGRK